ncbi:MAG: hypothetical protein K8L99_24030 [Anaerolineae bacterium]|nr:hypothetical protein [Anaerolineae bacterium]
MEIHKQEHLDLHVISKTGHWCPRSQEFAGAHNLLWALDHGWQLDPEVVSVQYPCRTKRSFSVFQFTLHQDQSMLVMSVINTPYLVRLITERDLYVISSVAQVCVESANAL